MPTLENTPVSPKTHHTNHATTVDAGAAGHCLDATAKPCCTNIHQTNTGPSVQVANKKNVKTSKRAIVRLSTKLSTTAKIGRVFDDLKTRSLTSIGQLCDDDCIALFTKCNVKIYKNGQAIVVGTCNTTSTAFGASPWHPKI
jgi:hypothetical protein